MASNYPASLDNGTSLPNPSANNNTNNPSHAGLHDNENAAIIATQTKLGTGASTPAINTLMYGTGSGTSAWTQLTSSQLAASMADETGSGSLVFGTTPTLLTPKIDTINESTLGNGTTIGGVNIKNGAIQTPGAGTSTLLAQNAVQANQLATNAITLGYAQATSDFTTTSVSSVQVTSLTLTVTIPAGNRRIRITGYSRSISNSSNSVNTIVTIWDGVVGSGTQISQTTFTTAVANQQIPINCIAIVSPAAGSKTYNIGLAAAGGGTATLGAASTAPSFILVEAI